MDKGRVGAIALERGAVGQRLELVPRDRNRKLGRSLADRKEWRPALDALRLSLDLREAADLRGQYERLRVEAGLPGPAHELTEDYIRSAPARRSSACSRAPKNSASR